jgi:hypothetical protein
VQPARQTTGQQFVKMTLADMIKTFVTKKSLLFNNLAFASNVFVSEPLETAPGSQYSCTGS